MCIRDRLYNLAELQNDCSKYFKISPDETLRIVQELYDKKLTTYHRTDARVLSSAVATVSYTHLQSPCVIHYKNKDIKESGKTLYCRRK